jgi:hypothetical protein
MTVRCALVLLSSVVLASCSLLPEEGEFVKKERLHSSQVGQDYTVYVGLPRSHASSDARYPVLYLLDADVHFTFVHALVTRLADEGRLPEVLLVGVGYGGEGDQRLRDFTPTADVQQNPDGGGAGKYLEFLTTELIPHIDRSYRTLAQPGQRALAGHSLGGLFAYYTLFRDTGAFGRYLAASPSLPYDSGVIFESERAYATAHPERVLPARLFTTVGQGGDSASMVLYAEEMQERLARYQGLEHQMVIFNSDYHGHSWKWAYEEGLPFLFADGER